MAVATVLWDIETLNCIVFIRYWLAKNNNHNICYHCDLSSLAIFTSDDGMFEIIIIRGG